MYTFEDFVREHKNLNFDWKRISKNSKLSEKFMKEFADKLDWKLIARYQKFSNSFENEMKDYLKNCKLISGDEEFYDVDLDD